MNLGDLIDFWDELIDVAIEEREEMKKGGE